MCSGGLPTSFTVGSLEAFYRLPTSLRLNKYCSLGQKSVSEITSLNSECWKGCFSSGSYRGGSISLPFPNSSRQLHFLGWQSPFSISEASSASPWTSFCGLSSLWFHSIIILSAAFEEGKCRDRVIVCYVSSVVCCVLRFLHDCLPFSSFCVPFLSMGAVCITTFPWLTSFELNGQKPCFFLSFLSL